MKSLLVKFINLLSYKLLPPHLKLRGIYISYLLGNPEPELRHLKRIVKKRNTAIDVGANVGLWTYHLSKLFNQVIAFEMNEDCYKYIEQSNLSNAKLHKNGLSDDEKYITFYLPILENGFKNHGWATIEKDRKEKLEGQIIERRYLVTTLDSYNLDHIDFIKIDVEGHEVSVISGALNTIKRNRPIMVIETDGNNLELILQKLSPIGYKFIRLEKLIGVKGSEQNVIFYCD